MAVALLGVVAGPVAAQRIESRFNRLGTTSVRPIPQFIRADTTDKTGRKIISAILGGGIGMVGGAFVGSAVERATDEGGCEDCGLAGAIIGAAIGEGLLLGAGVHLADPVPRKTFRRLVLSPLISGAALLAAITADEPAILLIGLPIQFAVVW